MSLADTPQGHPRPSSAPGTPSAQTRHDPAFAAQADAGLPRGPRAARDPRDPVDVRDLPESHRRYGCPPAEYVAVLDAALPRLVASGAAGVTGDGAAAVAVAAGVTRQHPLLADPDELYREALRLAFRRIWPRPDEIEVEKLVPADAVRAFVRSSYRRHRRNPVAVQLIIRENLTGDAGVVDRPGVLESSPVVLQIDRVLMRGQDFGAFRPGISAEDLYLVIDSLCTFPAAAGTTFRAHYGTDLWEQHNADGLEHMACDVALAFLTTSMPTTQGSSYTHSSPSRTTPTSVAASLYSSEGRDAEPLRDRPSGSANVHDLPHR
ncbi:TetR family transcriptional regulator [Corynebacterium bovis]|uniref:TetR family transcriptional regulator n=1 Tax=Corynebacterium bovis TaxID=36808 RepID=UPI003139C3C7